MTLSNLTKFEFVDNDSFKNSTEASSTTILIFNILLKLEIKHHQKPVKMKINMINKKCLKNKMKE